MGLLSRAEAWLESRCGVSAPGGIRGVIAGFCRENPSFHCVVLDPGAGREGLLGEISSLTASFGAACGGLSGKNCLVLLPGGLDMELFSHRISGSTGSTVAFQFTATSLSAAFDALRAYLP